MNNPLFERWAELYKDARLEFGRRWSWPEGDSPRDSAQKWYEGYQVQKQCQHMYAWAVPDLTAIELLAPFSPIVEIAAGRGYWASLLQAAGADVVCYDAEPPDSSENNPWAPPEGKPTRFETLSTVDKVVFTEIREGGPEKVLDHQDRALFLCWPPYNEPMAHECLVNYTGDIVIYIGEGYGGCTGDNAFHDHLEEHFDEIEFHRIPFWDGLNDRLWVYRRKGTR